MSSDFVEEPEPGRMVAIGDGSQSFFHFRLL